MLHLKFSHALLHRRCGGGDPGSGGHFELRRHTGALWRWLRDVVRASTSIRWQLPTGSEPECRLEITRTTA